MSIIVLLFKTSTFYQFKLLLIDVFVFVKSLFYRIFFDIINTLQGLWVFIIFVCKKEIFQLIIKSAGVDSMHGVSGTGKSKSAIQV